MQPILSEDRIRILRAHARGTIYGHGWQAGWRRIRQNGKQQIAMLDWLTEGSVTQNHPGTWRWTRKAKAKTVSVASSVAQAGAFRKANRNHRRLEKLIRQMRAINQKCS